MKDRGSIFGVMRSTLDAMRFDLHRVVASRLGAAWDEMANAELTAVLRVLDGSGKRAKP